jgi:hypothetical protein
MRGRVCSFQLLMGLSSGVFLGSESSVLSQYWDCPNLEGQVPVFMSPRNRVAQLYPQGLGLLLLSNQSNVTADGQSASLSRCQEPIWDPQLIPLLLSLIIFRQLRVGWCGAPSLMRGRVCSFQLLLGLTSAVFLGSESRQSQRYIMTDGWSRS